MTLSGSPDAGEIPKIGKLEMDGISSEALHDGHSPTFLLFASEKIPSLNENGKFNKVTLTAKLRGRGMISGIKLAWGFLYNSVDSVLPLDFVFHE